MKRDHKEVRKAVLKVLNDGKPHSYGDLERTVNTNWRTIRDHVEDLVLFELAAVSEDNKVNINQKGRDFFKRL